VQRIQASVCKNANFLIFRKTLVCVYFCVFFGGGGGGYHVESVIAEYKDILHFNGN
jgi:hypothetical protein